jgi:hypothetical protein
MHRFLLPALVLLAVAPGASAWSGTGGVWLLQDAPGASR